MISLLTISTSLNKKAPGVFVSEGYVRGGAVETVKLFPIWFHIDIHQPEPKENHSNMHK